MRALVFTLLLMALIQAFVPYLNNTKAAAPRSAVEELSGKAKSMSPDEIAAMLRASPQPTMLVIYASWCPYCKQTMPAIHDLWREKKLNASQVLFLSVDSAIDDLSEYLIENRLQQMIAAPVILNTPSKTALAEALKPLGSGYKGGIPYIGFFDKGGRFRGEIQGAAGKSEIAESLVYLK